MSAHLGSARAALEAFCDCYGSGDVPRLVELFAEDGVFELNGEARATGKEDIGRSQAFGIDRTDPRRIELRSVAAVQDSVLAEATFHAVVKETGARVALPLAIKMTIRDGRIARFAEYFDMVPRKNFDGVVELTPGELLGRLWVLLAAGDLDAARLLLSWDCVYDGPFQDHRASGVRDVSERLGEAVARRGVSDVELLELAQEGDTAIAEGVQILARDAGSEPARLPFACVVEARDGQIVRLGEYFDTSSFREPEPRDLGRPPEGQ